MPERHRGSGRKVRPSSTGGLDPHGADQTNWRVKLQASRLKFDDVAKETFLKHYAEHGCIGLAARAAGVACQTVRGHEKNDPDFAEAFAEAKIIFREQLESMARKLALEGEDVLHIGRVGKDEDGIIAKQKKVVVDLLKMEMKRRNDEYKDKASVDLNVQGQPLYVPAELTVEQWKKLFGKPKPDSSNAS